MKPQSKRGLTLLGAAGLAVAAGAALLFGWLSEEVLEGETSHFDAWVRGIVHAASSPALTEVMKFFTSVGSVAATAVLLPCTLLIFWRREWRAGAVTLAITMAGAFLLDGVLKLAFHRQRPTPWFGMTAPSTFSYPSGHALLSFAFYATVAVLATRRLSGRLTRAAIWGAAIANIVLIGYSRIYFGMHYPSDVAAGYLVAFIWVVTVGLCDRWRKKQGSGSG